MNKEHMMLLVKANKEMTHPERFTMATYVHNREAPYEINGEESRPPLEWCGTPACVLGNLGAREDLQQLLRIRDGALEFVEHVATDVLNIGSYSDERIRDYFDLTTNECYDMFGCDGCNDAKTLDEALAYIESFIADNEGSTARERKGYELI